MYKKCRPQNILHLELPVSVCCYAVTVIKCAEPIFVLLEILLMI